MAVNVSLDLDNSALFKQSLRVLVVDGDESSRELLAAVFREYGIDISTATYAHESLQMIQRSHPDLLISEIMLPDQDGYSLIKQVKAFEATYGVYIPAIALTVYTEETYRLQALGAGFCKYLCKPVIIEDLLGAIADVTGGKLQP